MTSDPRTWMWAEAMEMLDRAERLQRRFFQPARPALRPTWEPPLDIYETDDAYWLVIALPGVRPDDIEIAIDGGFLTVVGERPIRCVAPAFTAWRSHTGASSGASSCRPGAWR